jgi:phenylacetate-coenzyme A ligase PaaK-like adenylate-forming protein
LTSGSSGRPGLFVYDTGGWRSIATQFLRSSTWAGLRPSLPRQRVAWLGGATPSHISRQGAATLAIGLHRVLALPVTLPLPQLVQALNQYQPTYLNVYPSVAMWLADEQQAGRLRLSPQMLVTAAELRTPEMTQRLVDAFRVHPFDVYGSTEGLFGSECEHHQGIHLFEDTSLVENVDPDGRPVPAGQPGARLLVTNLYNLVQPLLRLEVTDLVTLDPDPCPCGRTLVRVSTIHGRSDDVLSLPARDGGQVAVHPCTSPCSPATPRSASSKSSRTARSCTSSSSPAKRRQPATTHWRTALARPSPSNSSGSACRTHRSWSSAASSCATQPAASSSS